MEEASGGSYRQYDQILQKLMELEQRGDMELFAGDCPLEETARWHPSGTTLSATICGAAAAGPSILRGPASGAGQSFGRWMTSRRKT